MAVMPEERNSQKTAMWHPVRLSAGRGATFPRLEHAVKGIAPGLVEDARERDTGSWEDAASSIDSTISILLPSIAPAPVIYGQLVAARHHDMPGREGKRVPLKRIHYDGAALVEKSGAAGDRPGDEAKGERLVERRPPVLGDGSPPLVRRNGAPPEREAQNWRPSF
jgi:hypothetical protein